MSIVAASVVAHCEAENTLSEHALSMVVIKSDSKYICGGVILDKHWIITPAHCVEKHAKETLQISYGSCNRSDNHRISQVDSIEFHPKYKQTQLIHNIALIKVDLELDTTVRAINLPTAESDEDESVYVIGWEKTTVCFNSIIIALMHFVVISDIVNLILESIIR